MNYEESLRYLEMTASRGSRLGLERVLELVHRLDDPQNSMRVIHIAGTNGKGTVGAIISAVLTKAGYRTGHFSSPAITTPLDYFRINTQEIGEVQFAAAISEVQTQAETMEDPPTQFEILAAAAYALFRRESCDFAVIECCMGGKLDCTNVVEHPVLSVITNISLDHCGFLGNTLAEIAAQKAGIIKPSADSYALVNTNGMAPEAEKAICKVLDSYGKQMETVPPVDTQTVEMTLEGSDFTAAGERWHIPLLGCYQIENTCTALEAIRILSESGIADIPAQTVHEALAQMRWHGRFEVLSREPLVIYDGAHNPAGIEQAHKTLSSYFGAQKAVFVVGVMADKAYAGYADVLKEHIAEIYTVRPDSPRSLDADSLAEVFRENGIRAEACGTVADGVRIALNRAKSLHLPLIGIGSLYLYREFCEALRKIL